MCGITRLPLSSLTVKYNRSHGNCLRSVTAFVYCVCCCRAGDVFAPDCAAVAVAIAWLWLGAAQLVHDNAFRVRIPSHALKKRCGSRTSKSVTGALFVVFAGLLRVVALAFLTVTFRLVRRSPSSLSFPLSVFFFLSHSLTCSRVPRTHSGLTSAHITHD